MKYSSNMDTRIQQLISEGYTVDEAMVAARVIEAAQAERAEAIRTGRCKCGSKLVRHGRALECSRCQAVHAA